MFNNLHPNVFDFFGKKVIASSILVAEALVIKEAYIFYLKDNISRLGMERGCANILSWFPYGGSDPLWEVAANIYDVSSLFCNIDIVFSHVRQSANKVSDFVTKYVKRNGWIGGGLFRALILDNIFFIYTSGLFV